MLVPNEPLQPTAMQQSSLLDPFAGYVKNGILRITYLVTVFTLHFLVNLRMGLIGQCYITIG